MFTSSSHRTTSWTLCCLSLLFCLATLPGCKGRTETAASRETAASAQASSAEYREELFTYAIENLNRIEEFSSNDAVTQLLQRYNAKTASEKGKTEEPKDTLLAAWPEPEMLRQVVDRLNQWIRKQTPIADWKADPMLAALPKPLSELPLVTGLNALEFCRFDGYAMQEAVWLRDASVSARGESLDDLERANAIFDWTVRNIQIERQTPESSPQFPWETLLFGSGTAEERAWVFILLARQQGIDAAMIALPSASPEAAKADKPANQENAQKSKPWCVGALIDGKVYLYDMVLGMPIPGPNGVTRGESGQLVIQPATFAQVAADDALLRRLDADEAHPYPVKAADLKQASVLLEASPTYVSERMRMLESRLAGVFKMVLAYAPSSQAEHWKAAGLTDVQLWLRPYETIERRTHLSPEALEARLLAIMPFYCEPSTPLLKGRMLQLKGKLIGTEGAIKFYQDSRPSNQNLASAQMPMIAKRLMFLAKQDASYWSGLILFQRGNYPAAIDYFTTRTLLAAPKGPWTIGASYNLARTFEISGETDRAILQYQGNDGSPSYHGDLLRAKWLRELADQKKAEAPAEKQETAK